MKPSQFYELLDELANRWPAADPVIILPAEGHGFTNEKRERRTQEQMKAIIYPADIRDFLNSIT